ncbi:MAG: MoaD/ThiS family protein [Actinomycetota bacterium]|nr:MoaD/ThiS family protein [Actinomycetota bacterium]
MTNSAMGQDPVRPPAATSPGASSSPGSPTVQNAPRTVRLLLFAAARQAAGARQVEVAAATVGEVLEQARRRFGAEFAAVLDGSRVWLNGEPAGPATPLADGDEVAVLPPVSGG